MSLILEALRRSEAERRRGQTPDLLSDTLPATPAASAVARNRGALVAVAAAALLTLLLVAWWLRPVVKPEPAAMTGQVAIAPGATEVVVPTTAAAGAEAARSAAAPTSVPAPLAPPAARTIPAPPAVAPASAPTSRAVTQADTPPEPVAMAPAPPAAAEPAPVTVAEPRVPAAPTPFTSPDLPLRLGDLSSEERRQLPALKVSMHMWAPATADRFAIIDGTRVHEGDRVGDAVVEAIQQDGVMLSWRERRIRLPLR